MGKSRKPPKQKKFYLLRSDGYLIYSPQQDLQTADPDTVTVGDQVSFLYGLKTIAGEVLCITNTEDEIKREMKAANKASRKVKPPSFHAERPRAAKQKALASDFAIISSGKAAASTSKDQDCKKSAKQVKAAEKKRLALLKDKAAEMVQLELQKKRTTNKVKKEKLSSEDNDSGEEGSSAESSSASSSDNEPLSSKVKTQEIKDIKGINSGSGSDDSKICALNEEFPHVDNADLIISTANSFKNDNTPVSKCNPDKKMTDNASGKVPTSSPNKSDVSDVPSATVTPLPPVLQTTNVREEVTMELSNAVSSAGTNGVTEPGETVMEDNDSSKNKTDKSDTEPSEVKKNHNQHRSKNGKHWKKLKKLKKSKKSKKISKKFKKSGKKRARCASSSSSSSEDSSLGDDSEMHSGAESNNSDEETDIASGTTKGLKGPSVNCLKLDSTSDEGQSWPGSDEEEQEKSRKKKKLKKRRRHSTSSSSSSSSDRAPPKPKIRRNKTIYAGVNYLYTKESPGVVKLHDNYEVYVKGEDLTKAKNEAKTISHFIRILVDKIYTTEALQNSTAQGFPPRSFGEKKLKKVTVLPAIHPDGRLAVLAAAKDLENANKWRPKKDQNTISNVFSQRLNDFK